MGEKIIKSALPSQQQKKLDELNTLFQGCFIAAHMGYHGYMEMVELSADEEGRQQMEQLARASLSALSESARELIMNVPPPQDTRTATLQSLQADPRTHTHPLALGQLLEQMTHRLHPEVEKEAFAAAMATARTMLNPADPKAIRTLKAIDEAFQAFGLEEPGKGQAPGGVGPRGA